jgi:hypothetical protein
MSLMQHRASYRLLVSIAIVAVAAALALVSSVVTQASVTRAVSSSAPLDGCGVVSCTTYLPIVAKDYPPPAQLEVTQAVQQLDDSVPLIANRTTFVRLTLTSTVAHANVSAWLYGTRDGVALPGSPIAALNNPRTLAPTVDRAVLGDTFNFQLPSSWLNGNIVLGEYATNSTTFTFTSGTKTVQFVNAAPMHVTIVPIDYTCNSGGSGTIRSAVPYAYLTDVTYRMYPVPSIITTTHAALPYSGPCYSGVPNPAPNDWINILDVVTSAWAADGYPDSYYYGLLHIYCGSGCIAGIGRIGQKAAVGFDGFGAAHSYASQTHAHEVGHNHGRWHAPGCGVTGADPAFPYVSNSEGYIGNSAHPNYGFDIKSQMISAYATYYDIMGYCDPQWISDYTYKALLAYDQSQRAVESAAVQSERVLLTSGRIDPATGQVTFRPAYVLDSPDGAQLPDPGDYALELLDANGEVISAHPFAPARATADPLGEIAFEITGFHLTLPYVEGIASIRVRRGDAILGKLEASTHAPSLEAGVSALDANSRSVRVNWSGRAADGASLRYLVRASTDGGATWQTVGVDLSTPTLDLNPTDFGGQSVLVQILASDGLRTTSLRLGPFVVPQATVASP